MTSTPPRPRPTPARDMMNSGVGLDEAWWPDAFRARLGAPVSDDVQLWLNDIRFDVEDCEDWTESVTCKREGSINSVSTIECESDGTLTSDAFDDILKNLGNEIYQLESYQDKCRSRLPSEVERSIMNIFESCIEDVKMELNVPKINKIPSFGNVSILSDEVFLRSSASSRNGSNSNLDQKNINFDVNHIFYKGDGAPVPPKRKNRHSNPNEQSINIESCSLPKPRPYSKMEQLQSKLKQTKIDSDSGNNSPASDNSDYQNIWNCTSGSRNPAIARPFKENYGLINTISYDSVKDIPTLALTKQKIVVCGGRQSRGNLNSSTNSVNSTHSEGEPKKKPIPCPDKRYSYDPKKMVRLSDMKCTSECDLADECHRELAAQKRMPPTPTVRRAHQENIYENVETLKAQNLLKASNDDEYNSSVDITSDSDSWRTPMCQRRTTSTSTSTDYASESPIYENIEEFRFVRPITSDVAAWKALLLDPYWNDDEEDEWISAEEASVYARDQKPPYVIPRIKPYKQKPSPQHRHSRESHNGDEEPKSPTIKEVRRMFEEGNFNKSNSESPKFIRMAPRIGGSTEALAIRMAYSPHEASPIELRTHADHASRYSKAKSLANPERKEHHSRTAPQKVLPRPYDPNLNSMLEGFVNRTKLTENGKKVKKNWQHNYAVLTQTSLTFYKDLKAYQNAKASMSSGISGPAAEAFVPLAGALVAEGTPQQTKRPNPIIISSTSHQHMQQHILQHDEPGIIKHWFDNIRKAINKLPSDYVCPDNANIGNVSMGTPSPTQRRASGTKSSPKVPEGSMEDLSDIPEHVKVKSKLRKFFIRRPTMESLIKNGIYKDEPVFGRCLDQVCPDINPQVPEFVTRCIRAIESSEENMRSDGLYRASGNLSQVQKIRLEVDQNNMGVLDKDIDVHVLTGTLKLFFRELKEPLIPFRLFQRILNASSNPILESRTKEFRDIVSSLPECNRQTLKYLLEHLLRVTSRKEQNRMHISNLAIVLGPTLLWAPSEASHNLAIDCLQQNQVIEILLTDFDRIFKDEGKRK